LWELADKLKLPVEDGDSDKEIVAAFENAGCGAELLDYLDANQLMRIHRTREILHHWADSEDHPSAQAMRLIEEKVKRLKKTSATKTKSKAKTKKTGAKKKRRRKKKTK